MRQHAQAFVRIAAESFRLAGPVFEFRSAEADQHVGDSLRGLFPGQTYVSCRLHGDATTGAPSGLAQLTLAVRSAGTIVCLGTPEPPEKSDNLLDDLLEVLAPGAMLLLVAPVVYGLNRQGHFERPLTPISLVRQFARLDAAIVGWQGAEDFPHTVYALGCKGPLESAALRAAGRFVAEFTCWAEAARPNLPWCARLRDWLIRRGSHSAAGRRRVDQVQFAMHLPSASDWKESLFDPPLSEPSTGTRLDLQSEG